MAFTLADLGGGTGYIYEVRDSGAIDTFANTQDNLGSLKLRGAASRKMAVPDFMANGYNTNFYSLSRFYFNGEGSAPKGSITGAVEITDDVIAPTFTAVSIASIAAGVLTLSRKSTITTVKIVPETGNSDVLNIIQPVTPTDETTRPFLTADILILFADDIGDIIDVNDDSVASGNIKLENNRNALLTEKSCLILLKDGTGWREVCRTIDNTSSYAVQTVVAGGGTWNILDNTIGAAYLPTRQGLAFAYCPSPVTLTSDLTIQAEASITTRSQGQTITVIAGGSIILNGRVLTVFGIVIPRYLALAGAWKVDAWFDGAAYKATLTQTLTTEAWSTFTGLGTVTTNNSGVIGDILYLRKVDVMTGNGVIHLAGTVVLKVDYSVGGVPLSMVVNIDSSVLPEKDQEIICSVNNGEKICMVNFKNVGALINVTEITGFTLVTGDVVDLTPIKYAVKFT